MTIDEQIAYIRKIYPEFDKKVIRDVDNEGEFCEIIMPNNSNSQFPVTVSIRQSGMAICVGQISNITGCDTMSCEQAASAIKDITDDKIIFVLGFNNDEEIGFKKPFFTEIFAITGKEDDMKEEYEKFVSKISKPLSKISRYFTELKGCFIISNYSGSVCKKIIR